MSAIVVDGRTVQVASPTKSTLSSRRRRQCRGESSSTSRADRREAYGARVFAAPVSQDEIRSPVGSASWIAQVLARSAAQLPQAPSPGF